MTIRELKVVWTQTRNTQEFHCLRQGPRSNFTQTKNWKSQNFKGSKCHQGSIAFVRRLGNFTLTLKAGTKKKMTYHTLQNLHLAWKKEELKRQSREGNQNFLYWAQVFWITGAPRPEEAPWCASGEVQFFHRGSKNPEQTDTMMWMYFILKNP